nr:MAG TPA: hypothetical protein [Caudoviricetes sp.]
MIYALFFVFLCLTVHNRHLRRIKLHGFDNAKHKFVVLSTPV